MKYDREMEENILNTCYLRISDNERIKIIDHLVLLGVKVRTDHRGRMQFFVWKIKKRLCGPIQGNLKPEFCYEDLKEAF